MIFIFIRTTLPNFPNKVGNKTDLLLIHQNGVYTTEDCNINRRKNYITWVLRYFDDKLLGNKDKTRLTQLYGVRVEHFITISLLDDVVIIISYNN